MRWINYQYVCGTNTDGSEVLAKKRISYTESNLAIAKTEAYNGNYTIEDDGKVEPSNEIEFPANINMMGNKVTNMADAENSSDAVSLGVLQVLGPYLISQYIKGGTADLTPGVSTLDSGAIYLVYE